VKWYKRHNANTVVLVLNTTEGQTAQAIYEITLREEFAKMNELTGTITFPSGLQTRALDNNIVDGLKGTFIWEYDSLACLEAS
jgi:hypothetical protein